MHIAGEESTNAEKFRTHFSPQDSSRFEYWRRTGFSLEQWAQIKRACDENGLEFICTPFSKEALMTLKRLGVSTIKLGSGDLLNEELIEAVAEFNGDIILSTGMATEDEIRWAAGKLASKPSSSKTFMHCTSMYPTPTEHLNLSYLARLSELTQAKTGYSDHSGNVFTGLTALSLGADVYEAHVVFDRRQFGVDAAASLTIDEIGMLRDYSDFLNVSINGTSKDELARELEDVRKLFGRGLALCRDYRAGETILASDFRMKKPLGSLTWKDRHQFTGRALIRDVPAHRHLSPEDFAEEQV